MTGCMAKVRRARIGFDLCRDTVQRGDFCSRHIIEDRCARSVWTHDTFADRHQCRRHPIAGSDFCRQHGVS